MILNNFLSCTIFGRQKTYDILYNSNCIWDKKLCWVYWGI